MFSIAWLTSKIGISDGQGHSPGALVTQRDAQKTHNRHQIDPEKCTPWFRDISFVQAFHFTNGHAFVFKQNPSLTEAEEGRTPIRSVGMRSRDWAIRII